MNRSEFLASSSAALIAAGTPAPADVAGGKTFITPFASAPYPHSSRAQGHVYQGKLYDAATHYSNSDAGIFIPDGWRPQSDAIDLVVHFYGWNHDVPKTFATYRLREQLVASKRNAILVVPEGPTNAPDSGDGKLELDPDGFKRFITDVAAWLQHSNLSPTNRVGRIVLTAHSGGYGGAGGVLMRGGMNDAITDVVLFDAAYGYFDAFADWARTRQHHLLSVFTSDTSTGNAALMGKLQGAVPNLYVWLAEDMTLARLTTRAPTFVLTTSVEHDDLLQKYEWYSLFLQTTALDALT
ncbi:MAG TPA: hypothetical protein VGR69_05810 [Candidatus Rubrimentiphilum sp.]|nr:hypothetical protein [Candidatus Rubrimentiphilum sp.]